MLKDVSGPARPVLTFSEIETEFGLSEHLVRKGINDGRFVASRQGAKVLITRRSLLRGLRLDEEVPDAS